MQLKFSTKVTIGITTLVGISVFMGGMAIYQMGVLNQTIENLRDKQFAQSQSASDAQEGQLRLSRAVQSHILAQSDERRADLEKKMGDYRTQIVNAIDKLKSAGLTPEGVALMDKAAAELELGRQARVKVLELSNAHRVADAAQLFDSGVRPHYDLLGDAFDKFDQIKSAQFDQALRDAKSTYNSARWGTLLAILLGLIISATVFVVIRASVNTVLRITDELKGASVQVAAGAGQISAGSQELSSTANEQASAIEETSASLEELSGMVEQNLKSAERSTQLAAQVRQHTEDGDKSMQNLLKSMAEIAESNVQIENLVRVIAEIGEKTAVIDEIVFQTKLLSFNASVEAERAGEHGRGFAVVAQEVGNLAQMSGKAALEISSIVKQSIKSAETITADNRRKVEGGNHLAAGTADLLGDVAKSADQVLSSAKQILDASREQATGIRQISIAVENLNKATQENSSVADESASAGEELNSQAAALDALVAELNRLMNAEEMTRAPREPHRRRHHPSTKTAANVIPMKKTETKPAPSTTVAAAANDDGWESL